MQSTSPAPPPLGALFAGLADSVSRARRLEALARPLLQIPAGRPYGDSVDEVWADSVAPM